MDMVDGTSLTVSLSGKGVVEGTLRADRLASVLEDLQNTVNRIGMVVTGRVSTGRTGAFPKDVRDACALAIVGIRRGSVAIDLQLVPSPSIDREGLGERSIDALVAGITSLEKEPDRVPEGFDAGVLERLDRLASVMDDDVDRISFDLRGKRRPRKAQLTRASRKRISTLVMSSTKDAEDLLGDLLEVDLERNRCQVFPPGGAFVRCTFPAEMAQDLSVLLGRRVLLHGLAERRYGTTDIKAFQVLDVLGEEGKASEPPRPLTARTLLDTGIAGMWSDRVDVVDPVGYAEELRRRAGRRGR